MGTWECLVDASMAVAVDLHSTLNSLNSLRRVQTWDLAALLLATTRARRLHDLVSSTALLTACVRAERWQVACAVMMELAEVRLEADLVVYNTFLPAATAKGKGRSAIAKAQKWRNAMALLGDMKMLQVQVNVITKTSIMKAFEAVAYWKQALMQLDEMHGAFLEPTVITYDAGITACQQAARWQDVLLLIQMEKDLQPDFLIFCKGLSACCEASSWLMAMHLLTLSRRNKIQLDIIAYSNVMSSCEGATAWRHSWNLLHGDMSTSGALLDSTAVNIGMKTLQRAGKWDSALLLMNHDHLALLDVVFATSLLTSCTAALRWRTAYGCFLQFQYERLEMDLVAYNSLGAAVAEVQWHQALHLLTQKPAMEEDIVTSTSTMKAFERASCWRQTFCVFQQTFLQRLVPAVASFGTVIGACAKVFRWRESLSLLDACDDMAMTSCIVACGEALQWPSALTLHRAVHRHDAVSYGASLSACEVAGEWEWALHLLNEMCGHGVAFGIIHYSAAISACEKGGAWEYAMALLSDLLQQRLEPDVICYNAAISACEGSVAQRGMARALEEVAAQTTQTTKSLA
eukprot:symbB.v1.2.011662.t1/scaffold780.1/size163283/6